MSQHQQPNLSEDTEAALRELLRPQDAKSIKKLEDFIKSEHKKIAKSIKKLSTAINKLLNTTTNEVETSRNDKEVETSLIGEAVLEQKVELPDHMIKTVQKNNQTEESSANTITNNETELTTSIMTNQPTLNNDILLPNNSIINSPTNNSNTTRYFLNTLVVFDIDDTISPTTSIIADLYEQDQLEDGDSPELSAYQSKFLKLIDDEAVKLLEMISRSCKNSFSDSKVLVTEGNDFYIEPAQNIGTDEEEVILVEESKQSNCDEEEIVDEIIFVTAAGKYLPKFAKFLVEKQCEIYINHFAEEDDPKAKIRYKSAIFEHRMLQGKLNTIDSLVDLFDAVATTNTKTVVENNNSENQNTAKVKIKQNDKKSNTSSTANISKTKLNKASESNTNKQTTQSPNYFLSIGDGSCEQYATYTAMKSMIQLLFYSLFSDSFSDPKKGSKTNSTRKEQNNDVTSRTSNNTSIKKPNPNSINENNTDIIHGIITNPPSNNNIKNINPNIISTRNNDENSKDATLFSESFSDPKKGSGTAVVNKKNNPNMSTRNNENSSDDTKNIMTTRLKLLLLEYVLFKGAAVIKLREEEDLGPEHILAQIQHMRKLLSAQHKTDNEFSSELSNHTTNPRYNDINIADLLKEENELEKFSLGQIVNVIQESTSNLDQGQAEDDELSILLQKLIKISNDPSIDFLKPACLNNSQSYVLMGIIQDHQIEAEILSDELILQNTSSNCSKDINSAKPPISYDDLKNNTLILQGFYRSVPDNCKQGEVEDETMKKLMEHFIDVVVAEYDIEPVYTTSM